MDLEVFRGIHVYFMNITGMLVTLSQTVYLLDISVGHFEPDGFGSFSRHTCIFYEYNWYAGNTFSNLTIFYSYSLAISNDLLSLALLKTSHFILYQLIVWLFGMVCQISLSGIVN